MPRRIAQPVLKEAIGLLRDGQWSPEQISAHLKSKGGRISHETIYAYIQLHPELRVHCRHKMKYRHHLRHPKSTKATNIPNRVSIHERPRKRMASVSETGNLISSSVPAKRAAL